MLNNTSKQPGDDSIEQLLSSFSPAPTSIDRDQLMFAAGMRAAQATVAEPASALRTRLWPALAMVSTAAALVLGIVAWQRPERVVVVERLVKEQVDVEQSPQPLPEQIVTPQPLPGTIPVLDPAFNYVHRRDLVVREGPEALPAQAIGDTHVVRTTPTQRELLKELPGGYRRQYQIDSEAWWQSWLISGDRL